MSNSALLGHPEPSLTIIVPIYNRVAFTPLMVENVISNSGRGINWIFVDDGSSDNSLATLKSKLTPLAPLGEITYLQKSNGGVSSARNYGLKYAKTSHIAFLDSDDIYFSGSIHDIMHKLKKVSAPLFVNTYRRVTNYKTDNNFKSSHELTSERHDTFFLNYVKGGWLNRLHLGSCIYRADIIKTNKIKFDENLSYGEDQRFILEYLNNTSDDITICYQEVLGYFVNLSSATLKVSERRLDVLRALDFKTQSLELTNAKIQRLEQESLNLLYTFCLSLPILKTYAIYQHTIKHNLNAGHSLGRKKMYNFQHFAFAYIAYTTIKFKIRAALKKILAKSDS